MPYSAVDWYWTSDWEFLQKQWCPVWHAQDISTFLLERCSDGQCGTFLHTGLEDRQLWLWRCGTTWGATAPEQQKKSLEIKKEGKSPGHLCPSEFALFVHIQTWEFNCFLQPEYVRGRIDSSYIWCNIQTSQLVIQIRGNRLEVSY